jgi:predicted metal-dependent RNase
MLKKNKKVRKNRDLKALIENVSEGVIFEYKPPTVVDLTKNKEVCESITQSSCWRPDIFLDYGCVECPIQENCICPIKKLVKKEPSRRKKK